MKIKEPKPVPNPARLVPAKEAASKDAPVKKVPAKKASAKKAPAKKAHAKKAPAKKANSKDAPAEEAAATDTTAKSSTRYRAEAGERSDNQPSQDPNKKRIRVKLQPRVVRSKKR